MVTFDEFKNMEIVIAEILKVKEHPNADKLYILDVSIGDEEKKVIAGIKTNYSKEELKGKKVVLLNNLEPANIRGEESNGMILAAQDSDSGKISVLTIDKPVSNGSRVS